MNSKVSPETVLYLLAYAFQLDWNYLEKTAKTQDLEELSFFDLLCFVLTKWTNLLLKRGLNKSFQLTEDHLSRIKGKILFKESFRNNIRKTKTLFCEYDEISYNIIENRILISTVLECEKVLRKNLHISGDKKREERKKILQDLSNIKHRFKSEIFPLELATNLFSRIQYTRLNMHYKDIINLCYFIFLSAAIYQNGSKKFLDIPEGKLSKIFEIFLRNYLSEQLAQDDFKVSNPSSHDWLVDLSGEKTKYMPSIQPDIVIFKSEKPTLVIDAKFYGDPVYRVTRYNTGDIISRDSQDYKYKTHSGNIYQILAYSNFYNCNGLLVYAQAESGPFYEKARLNQQHYIHPIDNPHIGFCTLDLTGDLLFFQQRLKIFVEKVISSEMRN